MKQNLNSYLTESMMQFLSDNYITGRMELVDKDELFPEDGEASDTVVAGSVFRVAAYTLGYTRVVKLFRGVQTGFGGNITVYALPSTLRPFYGDRPAGILFYFRLGLRSRDVP